MNKTKWMNMDENEQNGIKWKKKWKKVDKMDAKGYKWLKLQA